MWLIVVHNHVIYIYIEIAILGHAPFLDKAWQTNVPHHPNPSLKAWCWIFYLDHWGRLILATNHGWSAFWMSNPSEKMLMGFRHPIFVAPSWAQIKIGDPQKLEGAYWLHDHMNIIQTDKFIFRSDFWNAPPPIIPWPRIRQMSGSKIRRISSSRSTFL